MDIWAASVVPPPQHTHTCTGTHIYTEYVCVHISLQGGIGPPKVSPQSISGYPQIQSCSGNHMFIHSVSSTGSQLCHTQKPAFRTLPASSSTLFDYFSKMFTCWGVDYRCPIYVSAFNSYFFSGLSPVMSLCNHYRLLYKSSFPTRAASSTHLRG